MILIKMDMPKNCHECPLQNYEYGCCDVPGGEDIQFYSSNKIDYWKTRDPKCPLIDFDKYVEESAKKMLESFPFAKRDYFTSKNMDGVTESEF